MLVLHMHCTGQDRPLRDWPEYTGEVARSYVFADALVNGWWDASWNTWTQPWADSRHSGMRKSNAYGASIREKACTLHVVLRANVCALCMLCAAACPPPTHTNNNHTTTARQIIHNLNVHAMHVQGSVAFRTNPGAFLGKYKMEFWVYVGVAGWEGTAAKVPDIKVSIRGSKA